jgi:hypothetical protein
VNYQNIFTCDLSQLPAERLTWESLDYAETGSGGHLNGPIDDFNNRSPPPNLVLVASISDTIDEINEVCGHKIEDSGDGMCSQFGASERLGLEAIYERPRSRRGSRESIPERGVEECVEDREQTPTPCGDVGDRSSHRNRLGKGTISLVLVD